MNSSVKLSLLLFVLFIGYFAFNAVFSYEADWTDNEEFGYNIMHSMAILDHNHEMEMGNMCLRNGISNSKVPCTIYLRNVHGITI